jgi:plastocyanin domain-containing protein
MNLARRLLLVSCALVFAACGSEQSGSDTTQTEASGHRVAVTVNGSGYEPSEVHAHAGEPLTLVFTRTTDEGCGQDVAIPSENIRRELPLNQPVEVTFTPRAAGRVRFTCGMDMYEGAIVVD